MSCANDRFLISKSVAETVAVPDTVTDDPLTSTLSVASATSGWKLLPGADIALELGGGSLNTTLSICSVSGTQKVVVQYA